MMSKQRQICSLFQLTVVSAVIVLISGAVALLWQLQQGNLVGTRFIASAVSSADVSVVGPPSLPAATVDAIFKSVGSPLFGTGKVVEQASRQANVDDAFALAVWWTETNDGVTGVGRADLNPGSVRGSIGYPSAYDGYTIYPSYTAAINYWFPLLKNRYVNLGLSTVYAVSHPYVGTSSSPLWAGKVVALMLHYRSEASPPQPTPTITHHAATPAAAPAAKILPATTRTAPQTREVQEEHPIETRSIPPPPQSASPLSPATELAIACLALLAALAIALWGLKITQNLPAPVPQLTLPITPIPTFQPVLPNTSIPMPTLLRLPSQNANRPPTLRRITLLPTLPDTVMPGEPPLPTPVGTRSTGLLSRYREAQEMKERQAIFNYLLASQIMIEKDELLW